MADDSNTAGEIIEAEPGQPDEVTEEASSLFVESGHFYSPITSPAELEHYRERLWDNPAPVVGFSFNKPSHRRYFKLLSKYLKDWDYPEEKEHTTESFDYYHNNAMFMWLDARFLYTFLRHHKPRKMIEVGSGMSSLIAADVNRRWLNHRMHFTCIEPYPQDYLLQETPGISALIQEKVQDVPLSEFKRLQSGDVLFIDSSHVCKTGSDVNYLYLQVLPSLKRGVYVHIHDIFLPFEYPVEWALDDSRSWNEQYLLQAFLIGNSEYQVIFGSNYSAHVLGDDLMNSLNREWYGGGSFWMKKVK